MKLRICNECFPKRQRALLGKAFLILTRKLGIHEFNGTIELHSRLKNDEYAGVGPTAEDAVAALQGKPVRNFVMNINWDELGGYQTLVALCREMVHVKQWLTAALGVWEDSEGVLRQSWHNYKIAQKDNVPYEKRPWELEAHDQMCQLAAWVHTKMKEGT